MTDKNSRYPDSPPLRRTLAVRPPTYEARRVPHYSEYRDMSDWSAEIRKIAEWSGGDFIGLLRSEIRIKYWSPLGPTFAEPGDWVVRSGVFSFEVITEEELERSYVDAP